VLVDGQWLLTPERAALHLPTRTAVVADLHLGYGRARRRRGEAVPCPGVAETLAPLRPALARHGIARLLVAGDLFEDVCCPALVYDFLDWLKGAGVELAAVVPGNHDRGLTEDIPLPVCRGGVEVGGWRVVHGDSELPEGRLLHGHFHPWLRRGRVSAPCFLVGARSVVLPALSPDARGVNVLGEPRWRRHRCCASAGDAVLDLGLVAHLGSRLRPGARPALSRKRLA
jgi:metallophosphoesterase superfamily enzyme